MKISLLAGAYGFESDTIAPTNAASAVSGVGGPRVGPHRVQSGMYGFDEEPVSSSALDHETVAMASVSDAASRQWGRGQSGVYGFQEGGPSSPVALRAPAPDSRLRSKVQSGVYGFEGTTEGEEDGKVGKNASDGDTKSDRPDTWCVFFFASICLLSRIHRVVGWHHRLVGE